MARFVGERHSEPMTAAAEEWKQRCLEGNGSVFSEDAIWTSENIAVLEKYFSNNLDEGEGDFFDKLERQLEQTLPEVKKLASEMLWLMFLCPSNIGAEAKRRGIERIWSWSGEELNSDHRMLSDQVLQGIGSSGTSFNTNRWRELVYFIAFTKNIIGLPSAERSELLNSSWKLAEWLEPLPENNGRQLRHMILYLLFPDTFERIFGGTDRRAILLACSGKSKATINKMSPLEIDKELAEIRAGYSKDFPGESLDFYVSPLKEQWKEREHQSWLFTWNPVKWNWESLPSDINKVQDGKTVVLGWNCANSNVKSGDRAWLMRLGTPPKGIFAVGNIIKEPYEAEHYDPKLADQGKTCNYVDIEFTQIFDVFKDPFVTQDDLNKVIIDNQTWSPQSSGIEIKKRSAGLLEKLWDKLPKIKNNQVKTDSPSIKSPTNRIFFGPPGTGKTYELSKIKNQYISSVSSISREQWLAEELTEIRWFDVVFMALYSLNKKAKVADIEQHEFVQQKAKAVGRDKHIKQQIWATLQTHTGEDSKTVKYSKRQPPFVFDKTEQSEWVLAFEWQEACEDLVKSAERLKAGQSNSVNQVRYEFVTFHQAYSYEDFVEGIRPIQDEETGDVVYRVIPGVFKRICQKAKNDPTHRYAIFIDEINRGNIAKIFGELITLIEPDKRGEFNSDGKQTLGLALTLPYSGDSFSVPKNLDIFGTMNTADRSIALLDKALRRRFMFEEMMPDSGVISGSRGDGYIEDGEGGVIDLRKLLDVINKRIQFLLNRDLMLGHAYLSKVKDFASLQEVLINQFVPLLQEYFYDDWHRIQLVLGDVGPGNTKIEPQIIRHTMLRSSSVLGFDHDDFDEKFEYSICEQADITPESIRKIYESSS
tara:strand:- start:1462 stop:4086 length:2625 start_codon:yes stop_codon:yes gene_type:complete